MKLYYKTFMKDSHAEVSFHQSKEDIAKKHLDEESVVGEINFKIERGRLFFKTRWMIHGKMEDTWKLIGTHEDYEK